MDLMSGFMGVLLGAFITCGFQEYTRRKEHKQSINTFLVSIKTEVSALLKRYESVTAIIAHDTENLPILGHFYITQNYFLVFDGQSPLLGAIQNDQLRSQIIETYIKMKGLIDSFKVNNRLYEEYKNYQTIFECNPLDHYKGLLHGSLQNLRNYAAEIRKLENETKQDVKTLITYIDKYLEKVGNFSRKNTH